MERTKKVVHAMPALIRPGRIDRCLRLGYLKADEAAQMLAQAAKDTAKLLEEVAPPEITASGGTGGSAVPPPNAAAPSSGMSTSCVPYASKAAHAPAECAPCSRCGRGPRVLKMLTL